MLLTALKQQIMLTKKMMYNKYKSESSCFERFMLFMLPKISYCKESQWNLYFRRQAGTHGKPFTQVFIQRQHIADCKTAHQPQHN